MVDTGQTTALSIGETDRRLRELWLTRPETNMPRLENVTVSRELLETQYGPLRV